MVLKGNNRIALRDKERKSKRLPVVNQSVHCILIILMSVTTVFAQSFDSRVAGLSRSLGSDYELELRKTTLIVKGFRDGFQVKEDRMSVYDLDRDAISYSEDESSVILRCLPETEDCITRELTRERKKKSFRTRTVFSVNEHEHGKAIAEEMKSLIHDIQSK